MGEINGVLILNVPPSANLYWRDRVVVPKRGGKPFVHRYLTDEAKEYKHGTKIRAYAHGWRPIRKPQDVILDVTWYRSKNQGDLSNRLKVLEDALQGVAYDNDSQVAEIHMRRRKGGDYMEVSVRPAEDMVQLDLEETHES
jgi:crossover junction endodeoxyribonuclease RusA